ncbi:recombinase family protein [Pseudacidovorax intermedius]|uniref:recombinase family protein n=1 Tax=Pseudacidovorax intermedius TaxID=433924 RepID=UPI00034C3DEB|nr:recombinase family protein [Pseudacidovorax intermedius]
MNHNTGAEHATSGLGDGLAVAQYVRMSTEHQRYSTENQSAAISDYARRHAMRIVKTYEDAGKSGLNLRGRGGLQALLHDVRNGRPGFSAVLVYDVSRWGRFPDPDEAAVYEHACKSRGIRVIYCAEPFNNDGSLPSTVFIGIKRSMAAEYSRELSVKVFAGACNIVQRGYRQGGTPGFGLRRQLVDEAGTVKGLLSRGEKKSIQTDRVILVPGPSEELDVVARIYRMFLEEGTPERVIASTLNREGILSDARKLWTRGTIHQILTNEKYVGNNVYNRTSFKLKIKHVHNPPESWIRCDGAFSGIVPVEQFLRARAIINARAVHLEDEHLLAVLRVTLEKHGALSGIVIDEEEGTPSSSVYRSRFGSLLRAYSLIGYQPRRNYAYLEINRALRKKHPELIAEMAAAISEWGGWTEVDSATDLLTVNSEFTTSLVIARCQPSVHGSQRWRIRFDTSLHPDITVVARMDAANRLPQDYYVFPAIDFAAEALPTSESNGFSLDAYRMDSLELLYQFAGRSPVRETP